MLPHELSWRIFSGTEAFARLEGLTPMTPFQQRGFLHAFLQGTGKIEDFRLLEINAENARIALPLQLSARRGGVVATIVGGKQASFHAPLVSGSWTAPPQAFQSALRAAASMMGADLLVLDNMPANWLALGNPLAILGGQPSPSDGWALTMDGCGEAVLDRLSDREEKKKFRYRMRKLEAYGPVSADWTIGSALAQEQLALLFAWKSHQFSEAAIDDPFRSAEIRRFLAEGLSGLEPCLRLFMLKAGEKPLAGLVGAQHGASFSGMLTSYDPDPEITKASPGHIMIAHLVRRLADDGFRHFDLGVGEARYKAHYCPEAIPLFDVIMGVSAKGRLAAPLVRQALRLKRRAKRDPRIMAALARLRKLRSGG